MTPSKLGALALVCAAGAGTAAGRPATPDDYARLARVGDPQVDPAGQWVAYTVGVTDVAADKGVTHIWMTSWDGARTVQLTQRPNESETTPRFSPDGRWLAFWDQLNHGIAIVSRDGKTRHAFIPDASEPAW